MPTSDTRGGDVVARRRRVRRWLVPVLLPTLALLPSGCQNAERGLSGREAEFQRLEAERSFTVLESGKKRVVFSARGREIAVEPPEDYCLDEESIAVTARSAFVLVADCMNTDESEPANGAEEESKVFPGILTLTVSGETAFGAEPGAMAAFESLLGTDAGARLLGRGDDSAPGRVIATRRIDGALYVLVEEQAAEGADSILAPRFWRAFTEVNDRLVLVTVSGFNDRPLSEDEMLVFLAAQMAELRAANGLAPSADERQIVKAVLAGL